jgi:hypothetical protein
MYSVCICFSDPISEFPDKNIIVVEWITSIGEDEVIVDLALSVFIDGESGNGILVNGNDEGSCISTTIGTGFDESDGEGSCIGILIAWVFLSRSFPSPKLQE